MTVNALQRCNINTDVVMCRHIFPARYDIKALVGRGSFSRVVRVEHRATRRPFAIKVIEVLAPEAREVCASELAVLQRVSHSNVIQMIEVFQFPQRVYMVLELATGGELLDRVISRGHFTERDATRALRMVLAGVGYLHNLGITHRDLKPDNLLYYHPGADSRLLVTDFGLAAFGGVAAGIGPVDEESDSAWPLRITRGTPEYMAPELLLRKPCASSVDMWALGVITYVVLSGSLPFEDDSRTRLYRSIVRGKCRFHGDVSVLIKLILFRPNTRTASHVSCQINMTYMMQDNKAPNTDRQTVKKKRIYVQCVQITQTITIKMPVLCIYGTIK